MPEQTFVPLPLKLDAEELSSITETQQKIILTLWHEPKRLTRIVEEDNEHVNLDISKSACSRAVQDLVEEGFVEKDANNVYDLTDKGKDLALMVARPNGTSEEEYTEMLTKRIAETYRKQGYSEERAKNEAESTANKLRNIASKLSNGKEKE
jgi:Mn-dependent DtxR family transcriptional regulator